MEISCVLRAAKYMLIAAVIIATSSLYADTKADCILHEENPVNLYSGALLSVPENTMSRENILLLCPVNNVTGYMDGILLAQGKGSAQTTKKKSPGERSSGKTGGNISLSVMAAYLMPMGDFADLYKSGYGANLGLSAKDVFVKGFQSGIETGCYYLAGKHENADSMLMFPFLLTAGYRIGLSNSFFLMPKLSAGYTYNKIKYTKTTGSSEDVSKTFFDPAASAGITIFYIIKRSFFINAGAGYNTIFEKDGRMNYLSFDIGAGLDF